MPTIRLTFDGSVFRSSPDNRVVDEEFWRRVRHSIMTPEQIRLEEEQNLKAAQEETRRQEERQRLEEKKKLEEKERREKAQQEERVRKEEENRRLEEEQRSKLEQERIRLEVLEIRKQHDGEMPFLVEKLEITKTVVSAINKMAVKKTPAVEYAVGAVAASNIVAGTEINSKTFQSIAQNYQKAIETSGDAKPALTAALNSEGNCRSWNEIHAELDKIQNELNKQQTAENGKLLLERLRESLAEAKMLAEEDAKADVIQMTKNLLDVIHSLELDEHVFMQKATVSCCVLGEQFPELIGELMKLINDYIK